MPNGCVSGILVSWKREHRALPSPHRNGLQWTGCRKLSFTSVGESACADSWGKALKTGEPALTIPCYAERR